MTKEDLIRMAREAGFETEQIDLVRRFAAVLGDFAAVVAAHEREQSAKVVENYCGAWDDQGYALAAAIRTRKEQ